MLFVFVVDTTSPSRLRFEHLMMETSGVIIYTQSISPLSGTWYTMHTVQLCVLQLIFFFFFFCSYLTRRWKKWHLLRTGSSFKRTLCTGRSAEWRLRLIRVSSEHCACFSHTVCEGSCCHCCLFSRCTVVTPPRFISGAINVWGYKTFFGNDTCVAASF